MDRNSFGILKIRISNLFGTCHHLTMQQPVPTARDASFNRTICLPSSANKEQFHYHCQTYS